ncbi:hypothetical protein NL676_001866, partial [Syzygium grande]
SGPMVAAMGAYELSMQNLHGCELCSREIVRSARAPVKLTWRRPPKSKEGIKSATAVVAANIGLNGGIGQSPAISPSLFSPSVCVLFLSSLIKITLF